ncbi:MAG: radical SAM protein [Candidatus Schekmanbacteria bacterium]|nr:radical SAM protein [Candidatus Schekmanbacteria bacterium]
MKLLLTSVFKPYGVDDEYGRKENIMELYHNQVTREQEIFSVRYHHRSFNLYLLAENIGVPTTILDFPTLKRFEQEVKKGYDYIGITFITPNFKKTQKMAEIVRRLSPKTKIILGGHGTQIPNLEKLVDCDHIVKGEGIRWLRQFFGENVDAPVKHPVICSADNKRVMGIPLLGKTGILLLGVGCPNACRFCSTTHHFDFKYTSFFKTTKEVFDVLVKIENKLGCGDFMVMDENFLKQKARAQELLALMKQHNKHYNFGVFSSAETIKELGAKFLLELGIGFVWIGVESKQKNYEKNKGIDMEAMFQDLRNHGVSILASTILFQEHHTKETIHEDIDFTLRLRPDFVQFMQLGPLPQTSLYKDYKSKGILREDLPYEEWHGQHRLWFDHPHFTGKESEEYLRQAFKRDYHELGPSIMRLSATYLQGYKYTLRYQDDPWLKERNEQLKACCTRFYSVLDVMKPYMPTAQSARLLEALIRDYRETFGPKTLQQELLTHGGSLCALKEYVKLKLFGDVRQPKTIYSKPPTPAFQLLPEVLKGRILPELPPNLLEIKLRDALSAQHIRMDLHGILDAVNVETLQHKISNMLSREERRVITLNIVNVQKVEDNSLYKLVEQLEQFHSRIKVLYSDEVESIRKMIEEIKASFETDFQLAAA